MNLLGRRVPTDWRHVERYPMTVSRAASMRPVPVGLGIDWHRSFFEPEKIGRDYYIGHRAPISWGPREGGHAIPCKPYGVIDLVGWWECYSQVGGSCTGYDLARIASLIYRKRFDGQWAYEQSQLCDEWDDTPPAEGSSVRASFDVARTQGIRTKRGAMQKVWTQNRWPRTVEEICACLAPAGGFYPLDYVILLNSWGRVTAYGDGYPHYVRLPLDGLNVLLNRDGEAAAPIL